MPTARKKVSDLSIAELKTIIHETVAEDLEAWKETFEILADRSDRRTRPWNTTTHCSSEVYARR